jgi:hypothetical protein
MLVVPPEEDPFEQVNIAAARYGRKEIPAHTFTAGRTFTPDNAEKG